MRPRFPEAGRETVRRKRIALASIDTKTINVNPAGFNSIDIKAPAEGGRFVCGTLDASRQGDGGQTVLSSVEIEDGVDGTCGWVDQPTGTPCHTADNPKPDQPRPANPAVGDSYLTYPPDPVNPTSTSEDKRWEQTTRYANNVSGYDPSSNWNYNGVCWSDWRYTDNNSKRWRLEFNHTEHGAHHPAVYGWEETDTQTGCTGTSVPVSGHPSSNPSPGDNYTVISDIEVLERTGSHAEYSWTETTYTCYEEEAEYWDDDKYWYDRVGQELRNYTIYNQIEVRHEYKSSGENSDYILDNLVVADVGSLASIAIPDIPGVDAHGCGLADRGAAMSIGGRDYLSRLYADWGNTGHLCLYGNGIVRSKHGAVKHGIQSHTTPQFKPGSGAYNSEDNTWGGIIGKKCLKYYANCTEGNRGLELRAHIWAYDSNGNEKLLVERKQEDGSIVQTWEVVWDEGYSVYTDTHRNPPRIPFAPYAEGLKFKVDVDERNAQHWAEWTADVYPFGEEPKPE